MYPNAGDVLVFTHTMRDGGCVHYFFKVLSREADNTVNLRELTVTKGIRAHVPLLPFLDETEYAEWTPVKPTTAFMSTMEEFRAYRDPHTREYTIESLPTSANVRSTLTFYDPLKRYYNKKNFLFK